MVAYNFKKQFAALVESGEKKQTIRAIGRRRHAAPGNALQLYTGQRTKSCRKLLDAVCTETQRITISITDKEGLSIWWTDTGYAFTLSEMEALATADGFGHDGSDPIKEFIEFFESRSPLYGVLIKWNCLVAN